MNGDAPVRVARLPGPPPPPNLPKDKFIKRDPGHGS